jgi:hypothetical protein
MAMDDHPPGADPPGADPTGAGPPAHDQADARPRAWTTAGTPPPDGALARYVDEMLALADSLNELPLDGVEPLLGPPRWA